MIVEVKLFAYLDKYLPPEADGRKATVELSDSAVLKDLISKLKIPENLAHLTLVNGKNSDHDTALQDGCLVSVFPPVAGGARRKGISKDFLGTNRTTSRKTYDHNWR